MKRMNPLLWPAAFTGAALLLFCVAAGPALAQGPSATPIGSRLELFEDNTLVESMTGVTLQLHRPTPAETAITFDAPWEGNNNGFVTVFKDGDLYRMYYRSVPGNTDVTGKDWECLVSYAESRDGIRFVKPNLGLVEFGGNKNNNIISRSNSKWSIDPKVGRTGKESWIDSIEVNFTPFLDSNPSAPSTERYKATGGIGRGLFTFVSPDGINWKQKGSRPVMTQQSRPIALLRDQLFESHNSVFWDTVQEQYVAYVRDSIAAPDTGELTRGIRRSVSKDFVEWSIPELLDYGSSPTTQLYTVAVTPYFRAPHIYFAFPMRYLDHRERYINARFKVPKEYAAFRGTGLTDAVFMSSRDGMLWPRRFLEAFVRPGADMYNWTDRSNAVALGLVPTGPDEMSVYIAQHYRLPSNHVRRGVLRLDGIVSVNASYRGGEVVTTPVIFTGRTLVVNYATSAAGGLRVELQDVNGKPIRGFALKDAVEQYGDSVRQTISWDANPHLKRLAGTPVRIRFVMKDADLYSYQFQD